MPGTGYQGDPGLFGFLGNVAKGALGIVGASGLPGISNVARGLGSIFGNKRPGPKLGQRFQIPNAFPSRPMQPFAGQTPRGMPVPGGRAARQRFFPGGATGLGEGCPTGYKPNKSDYFLKTGEFVEAGSRCVKIRKRNPLNPRAFDRALGRLEGAQKFKTRLARITIRPRKCPA